MQSRTKSTHNLVIHEKSGKYRLASGARLTEQELNKLQKLQGGFWLIVLECTLNYEGRSGTIQD